MSWSGSKFHCIKCGSLLEEETAPEHPMDVWDFGFEEEFAKYQETVEYKRSSLYYSIFGDSNTYHCTNQNCSCNLMNSVVLFHPLGDIGSSAGDSLAFGIQFEIGDNIFCFMCGDVVNRNKMCCAGKGCCYTFSHALDIIETPKIVFGLGFIK